MALLDVKYILWKTLREQFTENEVDIKILREYPKTVQQLEEKPIISISRVSGAEEIMMVQDLIGNETVNSTDSSFATTSGYLNQEIFELSIWSLVSEIRDDLLILTRQLMFEKRMYYNSVGFQKVILVGATDEEIDMSKIPAVIYRGVLRYVIMSKVKRESTDQLVEGIIPVLNLYSSSISN